MELVTVFKMVTKRIKSLSNRYRIILMKFLIGVELKMESYPGMRA